MTGGGGANAGGERDQKKDSSMRFCVDYWNNL